MQLRTLPRLLALIAVVGCKSPPPEASSAPPAPATPAVPAPPPPAEPAPAAPTAAVVPAPAAQAESAPPAAAPVPDAPPVATPEPTDELPPGPAVPTGKDARKTLLARVPASPEIEVLGGLIDAIATAQEATGGSPGEVMGTDAWNALIKHLDPVLTDFTPGMPDKLAALEELAAAAASRLDAEGPYTRHAAYRALQIVLMTVGRGGDGESAEAYRALLYERFVSADNKERVTLTEALAAGPSPSAGRFLAKIATDDKHDAVRTAAITALDNCPNDRCFLDVEQVAAWAKNGEPGPARSAALALAGRLHIDALPEWCAGQVASGPIATGCRVGLSRLQNEAAFKVLAAWLTELLGTPAAQQKELGDWLGLLVPYAAETYAAAETANLLERALVDKDRDLRAAAALGQQVGWLPDHARGKAIVKKALKVWEGVLADRPASEAVFVAPVLDALVAADKKHSGAP